MKRISAIILCIFIGVLICQGQGRSISLYKKIKDPIILISGDTLKLSDVLEIQEGTLENGDFKFVQLLNKMNEPIQLANSRFAYVKQPIKFFKEQDGTYYAFTKFFCVNIISALKADEVRCSSITKLKKDKGKAKPVDDSKYDKLKELKKLLDDGILTKEEFELEKKKILDRDK